MPGNEFSSSWAHIATGPLGGPEGLTVFSLHFSFFQIHKQNYNILNRLLLQQPHFELTLYFVVVEPIFSNLDKVKELREFLNCTNEEGH